MWWSNNFISFVRGVGCGRREEQTKDTIHVWCIQSKKKVESFELLDSFFV